MDEILASIRRILAEDETADAASPRTSGITPAAQSPALLVGEQRHDVLELDASMLVEEPPSAPMPDASVRREPTSGIAIPMPDPHFNANPPESLVAPEAAAATAASVGSLVRHLAQERNLQVTRGGPSLEDVIRDEMRPLLKHWLDTNLPVLVERLVRAEIARVVDRSVG